MLSNVFFTAKTINIDLNGKDKCGKTLLLNACINGHKNVVKVNFPSQLASLAFLVDESPIHEKYANYVIHVCINTSQTQKYVLRVPVGCCCWCSMPGVEAVCPVWEHGSSGCSQTYGYTLYS
mgnify:CR=1 FL=1